MSEMPTAGGVFPAFDPPDTEFASAFWSAIDNERIVLPRCSVCGEWQWYPEGDGTDCAGGEFEWVEVAPRGTVYSWSVVHRSFLPGGRDRVPYVVGMVDLDEVTDAGAGVGPRLVANLTTDTTDWKVGDRVRASFPRRRGSADGPRHLVFVRDLESDDSD